MDAEFLVPSLSKESVVQYVSDRNHQRAFVTETPEPFPGGETNGTQPPSGGKRRVRPTAITTRYNMYFPKKNDTNYIHTSKYIDKSSASRVDPRLVYGIHPNRLKSFSFSPQLTRAETTPTRDVDVFQAAAADRIMRATKRYGLTGNMEDAHYAMYAADAARRAGLLSHAEPREQGSPTRHGANGEGASASKEGRERGSGGKPQPVGWSLLFCAGDEF